MGTQKGIIKLSGSVDGLTFYRAYGKDIVRKASGPSKEQIMSGENFQRTRENNSEFGGCSKISKSVRTSLLPLKSLCDGQFGNRLTKLFKFVTLHDDGARGERPIKLSSHREAFRDFECNINNKLSKAIGGIITTNHNEERTLSSIALHDGHSPAIQGPEGATHFRLVHALGIVSDFVYNGKSKGYVPMESALNTRGKYQYSDYFSLEEPIFPAYTSTISLSVTTPIPDTVSIVHAFGISFFQQIGSTHYPLKQGNALKILEIF